MTIKEQRELIEMLNDFFNIELMDTSRVRSLVDVRQTVMFVLRNMGYTTIQIGRMFEKDHATVIYACRKVKDIIEIEPEMNKLYRVVNSLVLNFIQEKRITTRKVVLQEAEKLRQQFCRLLHYYRDQHEDKDYWLSQADISQETYDLYTKGGN